MTSRALCGGATRAAASRCTGNRLGLHLGFGTLPLSAARATSSAGDAGRARRLLLLLRRPAVARLPLHGDLRLPCRLEGRSPAVGVGVEARGLRRGFSVRTRALVGEKKEGQNELTPPAAKTAPLATPPPARGILKVLPLSSLTPHEDIYTVPNLLTFSRLIASPFIGYAILHDAHTWALGLFVYAGVSDLLDGWIARRWKLQTVVGSVVDPMADKILMTILTVCLAAKGALPVWLAFIILGRDVGLGIAAIYYRWISLPPPKTFMRYWDFSLPSAEVRPTTISKYNTFLQLALMGSTVVAPLLTADVGLGLVGLQYIVATTTVWSGLSYVFSKDAVKILSDSKNQTVVKDDGKDKVEDQHKL